MEIRCQIEVKPLRSPIKRYRTYCKDQHQCKQKQHHNLCDLFHSILKPHSTNCKTSNNNNDHKESHCSGFCKHIGKHTCNSGSILSLKFTSHHLDEILDHPACNCCVEHHQQIVSGHSSIFIEVPFGSFGLQPVKGKRRTYFTGSSDRKFHYHDRKSKNQ